MDQFLQVNLGQVLQVVAILVGVGVMVGSLKTKVTEHAARLGKVEAKLDTVTTLMIGHASHEERLIAMDQRMLAQGQRIDSQGTIIAGRLDAINAIVAGHTAKLDNLRSKSG